MNQRAPARILWALLAAGVVAGVFMRWVFPEADPPLHRQTGAPWWNECVAHDARNGALWGAWNQDDFNPGAVSPMYTMLTEQSLRWFGMSYFSLRFPTLVAGTIVVFLALWQVRAGGFSRTAASVGAFTIATSWAMVGFGRTAIIEPIMLAFLSASLLLVLIAEGAARWRVPWYLAAGIVAGLAVTTKVSSLGSLAGLCLYLFFGLATGSGQHPWRWRVVRSTAFGIGIILPTLLAYWIWILPQHDAFQRIVAGTISLRQKSSLLPIVQNVAGILDSQVVLSAPAVVMVLAMLMPGVFARTNPATEQQRFTLGMALTTFVAGVLMHIRYDVPPQRMAWLNLLFPILIGACWHHVTASIAREPEGVNPVRALAWNRSLRSRIVLWFCGMLAGLTVAGWFISPNGGVLSLVKPDWAAWLLFTMNAKLAYKAVWIVSGAVMGVLVVRSWEGLWQRRELLLRSLVCAQLAVFLLASGCWLARVSYTIRDASISLGERLGDGTPVLGALSVPLAYANRTRPLFWYPGVPYANNDDATIASRFSPRYLLIPEWNLPFFSMRPIAPSPYIREFLDHPIAEYRLYEVHGDPGLSSVVRLYERTDARPSVPGSPAAGSGGLP